MKWRIMNSKTNSSPTVLGAATRSRNHGSVLRPNDKKKPQQQEIPDHDHQTLYLLLPAIRAFAHLRRLA
jgi:hypothetical protein